MPQHEASAEERMPHRDQKRIAAEFNAAITCRHGHTIAPACGQGCRRANWLDSVVRRKNDGDQSEPVRTVRDVIQEFLESGKIGSIEVVERMMKDKVVKERLKQYTKLAALAGMTATAGLLIFEGGKYIYRIWTERTE